METDYERFCANLELLAAYYLEHQADRNEATTRLQLIDRLFFDCLGWSKETDVESEQSQDGEYADYTFLAPRRIMIVEAKREGKYFEIPAGEDRLIVKLQTICRDNSDLESAIKQAMGYCQKRGVPIGVVANGHQVVSIPRQSQRWDRTNGRTCDGIPVVRVYVGEVLASMASSLTSRSRRKTSSERSTGRCLG